MKKQIRQDVLNFIDKFSDSAISAYSGQSAFFLMLSFFPFMLFFFSLLNLTPLTEADFVKWTQTLVPESFHDIIDGFASDVYASGSGRISITVITAIYLSSKAFISLQRGLDDMYQVRTRKNFIFIRLYSILYSIVFAIILILMLGFLVFGNNVRDKLLRAIGISGNAGIIGNVVDYRMIICIPVLILFFWLLYIFLPNRIQRAGYQLPGAVFSAVTWIIFSGIFSIYVDKYNNYASFYGTMTTIALIMVWLYGCMYVLFLGGLINATFEERIKNKKITEK